MTKDTRPNRLVTIIIVSATALLLLAAFLLFSTGRAQSLLASWDILPEPERITELYFTNPTTLPTTFTPNKDFPVAFTVHNLEHEQVSYKYSIVQESAASSEDITLAQGYIDLEPDEQTAKTVSVAPHDRAGQSNVKVLLVRPTSPTQANDHTYEISYWVNNLKGGKKK